MATIAGMRPMTESGFTLAELVVIILLVGILAYSVVPRFMNKSAIDVNVQAQQLASDIRYAQSLSMTKGARHCIYLNPTSAQYQLRTGAGCITAVTHPATGSSNSIALANVSMVAANISGGYIEFDGRGAPFTFTVAANPAVITLSAGGLSREIRVSPETGRVIVQ